jgi:iron complex outermembrane receptor protein
MMNIRTSFLVLASLGAGVAAAQSGTSTGGRVDEITVTTRKVEESLQDVPIAISAFSQKEIQRRGVRELEDLALATPGLSFEDYGGGFGSPVIRGGSQLRIQDLDSTTSVYLDGVYLARQYMFDVGTGGLERIEVVKGPQSALFGRNAFLGAINYVSGSPGDELDVKVGTTIGSDERFDVSGEISGPILGEKLKGRVLAAYSEFDGTFANSFDQVVERNYGTRGTTGNIGGFENQTIGINLESQLTDALSLELDYYNFQRFQEVRAGNRVETPSAANGMAGTPGDMNCSQTFAGGTVNRFYCGEIPQKFSPLPGGSPAGTKYTVDPRAFAMDTESDFIHASARYAFSDSWRAVYQFGWSDSEIIGAGSNDRDPALGSFSGGQPTLGVNVTAAGTNEYTSHEFRVEFDQNQWSAMLGGFTSKIEDFDLFDFANAPFRESTPFVIDPETGINCPDCVSVLRLTRAATDVTTNAVFGRIGWTSGDGIWRVGLEARYQNEEKKLDPNTLNATNATFKDDWDTFTPRFTLDYRLTDTQLLYASIAKGAKSGGFNNTVFDESQRSYEPDENWTYEIGSKNDLLDGRLRVNAAVYYTDWQDLQINSSPIGIPPGTTPPAIVANTGGADIWGVEVEGTWFATDMLSFDYGVAYTNSEYTSGSKSARIGLTGGCDGIVCPVDGDIGGNQLQRQPAFQTNLGAALAGEIVGDWNWYARADVNYQTKQYMDELNLAWLPDRTLVNARFEVNNGPLTASLWVKNLFDEEYGANGFFIATPFGTSYVPLLGDLRTFGLTVRYEL